jgi:hypothetical protein
MRCILIALLFISLGASAQWKDYKINGKGDTLNRVDMSGRKQGIWVHHYDNVRGEPGYEEEGKYINDRKEGEWRLFTLTSDLVGIENYRWGFMDGLCVYFNKHGEVRLEQQWKALNPDKQYDTLVVEDPDKLDTYRTVVIKNEGASLRHGIWKYYDATSGSVIKTERYTLGKLENEGSTATVAPAEKKAIPKPKEVLDFEKKNSDKKKVKYRDGTTGG